MGQLFYYRNKDDQQRGPFTPKQMRELIRIGEILPLTGVRTDRMKRWVHAFNLKNAFPDYVPPQEQPSPPKKRWGTRYAIHLLKNPLSIVCLLMLIGIVFAAYRSLELPWLFPPNKMPSPVVNRDDFTKDDTLAPSGDDDIDRVPERERVAVTTEQAKARPSDQVSGNSTAGQIHRGIMGEQWCIKPCRMFELPDALPEGRFFFESDKAHVLFSCRSPLVDLNPNAWPLPGLALADYGEFAVEHAICRISSYSQTNRHFSVIASTLDGLLVQGRLTDWKKLAGYQTRNNFQLGTELRFIEPQQVQPTANGPWDYMKRPNPIESQRATEVTIAITGQYGREKVAISAMYRDNSRGTREPESQLERFHRLTVISPQGRLLAKTQGPTLSARFNAVPSDDRLAAMEDALPYVELTFSRNGDYLAGYKPTGEIDVLHADTLQLLFTVPGVHMGGPYHPESQVSVHPFAGHRLSFSKRQDLLLANDRGQVVLIDIRTEKVHRYPLRAAVQACCFGDDGRILAASTDTGEVYRIDPKTAQVVSKALLAGLGPLTTSLNFSADGDYLSGIFDEAVLTGKGKDVQRISAVKYAMFWELRYLDNPGSRMTNHAIWSCQKGYRKQYPGRGGAFVGFTRPANSALIVAIYDPQENEYDAMPLRALVPEAQKNAILLHALVERVELPGFFHPEGTCYTYEVPKYKPFARLQNRSHQDEQYSARFSEGAMEPAYQEERTSSSQTQRDAFQGLVDTMEAISDPSNGALSDGMTEEESYHHGQAYRHLAEILLSGADSDIRHRFDLD